MKKFIAALTCVLIAAGCASCSSSNGEEGKTVPETKSDSQPVVTQRIKTENDFLQTTVTTADIKKQQNIGDAPKEKIATDGLISVVEKNLDDSLELSCIVINDKKINMDTSADKLIDLTGLELISTTLFKSNDEDITFYGFQYGVPTQEEKDWVIKPNPSKDPPVHIGTVLDIEYCLGSEIVKIQNNYQDSCQVKGVHVSSDRLGDDIDIQFCNGVKVGMTMQDAVNVLGECKPAYFEDGRCRLQYKNSNYAMFLECKDDKVDEIYLFLNRKL